MKTHTKKQTGLALTQEGFTLVEVLISIAVIVALATITVLSLGGFRENQAISNTVDSVVALVNQAEAKTVAGTGGTNYGVHFEAGKAVLFSGPAYDDTDPDNIVVTIDPTIELDAISLNGGDPDVIFDMLTGDTNDFGTLVIRRISTTTGEHTLTLSKTGQISSD